MSNSAIQLNRIVRSRFLSGKKITFLFAILFAAGLNSSRAQDTWIQKANFGGGVRYGAVGFSIGTKGYIGTGSFYDGNSHYCNDFWEYNPATNTWTQKANFGGTARYLAVGFSIGSKGYIGTGHDGTYPYYKNDFWEYDPPTNAWTQKANFGGTSRHQATGFSIGNKGYIGTGSATDASYKNDFWEYDPTTDGWTQKTNFGGIARRNAVGFSIGSKGYIGTGYDGGSRKNDFWEYDPANNSWTQEANFGGTPRLYGVGFSIGSKGYLGTGYDGNYKNDFWEYDPVTNAWSQKANFGGSPRYWATGFSIGTKGYIGTGEYSYTDDFWEYTPDNSSCPVPTNLSATNITLSSATVNWDAAAGAAGYKIRYKVSGTSEWTYHKITIGHSRQLNNLSPNTNYTWEVKTFCTINPGLSSEWSEKQHFTTGSLRIGDEPAQQTSFQIYPNPAGDHATIQFTLPQSSHLSIKAFDVSGKEIAILIEGDVEQGSHLLEINPNKFSKGVYLVKMISDFGIENQKLIVE